jgi:hypothetical protein
MTLCLAWKKGGLVHFASDSRISFGNNRYTDVGIKVFSIPVKIYSATDAQTRQRSLDYDHNIGMCFAGSTISAYLVKESVYEVLQHLQYTPYTDFSMKGISNIVSKFYEHTSRRTCEQIGDSGIADFLLGGYCPAARNLRVYKFTIDHTVYSIVGNYEEVLLTDGIEFLGSGSTPAREVLNRSPNIDRFRLLKDIIKDATIPSVGGNIQYGRFENNDFIVKGVQDYEIDADSQVNIRFNLRGTELYNNDFACGYDDFHISYPFIQPFRREMDEAIDNQQ